jgi:hypothetical protein
MRIPPALAAGLVVAMTAGGCGSDEDETTSAAQTTTAAEAATTTTPAEPADGPAKPKPEEKPPAEPEPQELTQFSTPSGNIGCVMSAEAVRCDIRERSWDPPAPPADCELDFGHGIVLSEEGRAELVCAGDTALGGEEVLEYGETSKVGSYSCTSAAAGITCQADNGHGFFLSRQVYELY